MKEVGIADLKARLSEHLRAVWKGRTLTVLDRDTPVARIVPYAPETVDVRRATRRVRDLVAPPAPSGPTDSLAVLLGIAVNGDRVHRYVGPPTAGTSRAGRARRGRVVRQSRLERVDRRRGLPHARPASPSGSADHRGVGHSPSSGDRVARSDRPRPAASGGAEPRQRAPSTPLGTVDALHLATALIWRDRMDASLIVATHDTALGLAARTFGFDVRGI